MSAYRGSGFFDKWRPDGEVRYQLDAVTGERVGILPATCKRASHSLGRTGYQITVRDGLLTVTCRACSAVPDPDHSWSLITTGPSPVRAELDDGPYADVEPHLIQGTRSSGGHPGSGRRPWGSGRPTA